MALGESTTEQQNARLRHRSGIHCAGCNPPRADLISNGRPARSEYMDVFCNPVVDDVTTQARRAYREYQRTSQVRLPRPFSFLGLSTIHSREINRFLALYTNLFIIRFDSGGHDHGLVFQLSRQGYSFQISSLYSCMVRSVEKKPLQAVFMMLMRNHRSWSR